jgi:hypothetical protein
LDGYDFKASSATGSPLSITDVAAIQADRHRWSGIGRRLDLKLTSGIESELLGSQIRFESLGGRDTCMRIVSPFRQESTGNTSWRVRSEHIGNGLYRRNIL